MSDFEKRKKHIERLPIAEYPDYSVMTSEVAVTIPLFHSPVDSGFTEYNERRIRDIHVKGAIWTALSLINNTDLADCGVGIYFHLEDKIYDIASEVFEEFGVPGQFIRVMTIDDFETRDNTDMVQYGKKYMFLDDEGLSPKRWLMMDSDAFICKSGDKFEWYDCFSAFANPSALNVVQHNYGTDKDYRWWVWMCCLAAGNPFDSKGDINQQERDALSKLEVGVDDIPKLQRWYTCSQMVVLPVRSNLVEYIKRHYKRCHWDEGLLNVYQMLHGDISYLPGKIGGLNKYTFESEYVDRDKSLDVGGYVAHLLPDNKKEMTRVDEYWDEFYESLLPGKAEKRSYSGISHALEKTNSDKERIGAHRYGMLYDLIFDSVYLRQGRKLRVCEIGVSMFGEGSLKAYQDIDIVESVVAIDKDEYKGVLADSTTFYQCDAYTFEMIDRLKAEHSTFDIIIDDGSHDPVHQEFFLLNYKDLLTEGGVLVCEDVSDRDFFVRMRKEHDFFSFDGWANREGKHPDGQHNERMLIHTKPGRVATIKKTGPVGREIVKYTRGTERLRCFVLSVPYARTSMDMITCAFVQRTWKLCKALTKLGHEVIHLGHVDSDVMCSSHISVTDDDVLKKAYGYVPHDVVPAHHSVNDYAFRTFGENALPEIRKHAKKDDLVLAMYGWGHKALCDSLSDLPVHIVEPSIGYPDSFAKYRCYQSSAKMHFERGKRSVYHNLLKKYPDDEKIKKHSLGQALSENVPDHNTVVFPNLYDFEHFKYCAEKSDYILYLGRIHACKGLEIAFNLAEYMNIRLVVAGPGDINKLGFPVPKQVEYVGVADVLMRSELLEKALAIICPSLYIEPGLGTHIEALFAGTPPVTTNWGAPMDYNDHGRVGYRCQDFNDFVVAIENIDSIDPAVCRDYAIQFSSERLSIAYHEWFHRIIQHETAGFWSVDTGRKDMRWLDRHMTEASINDRVFEIQKEIGVI